MHNIYSDQHFSSVNCYFRTILTYRVYPGITEERDIPERVPYTRHSIHTTTFLYTPIPFNASNMTTDQNTTFSTTTSFLSSIFSRQPQATPPPTPLYTPTEVPRIKKAQKHASGTRTKQLIRAAERDYNDPPVPGECCGSSCDPCVMDLWREEMEVWRERWGGRVVEKSDGRLD